MLHNKNSVINFLVSQLQPIFNPCVPALLYVISCVIYIYKFIVVILTSDHIYSLFQLQTLEFQEV